MNYLKMTYNVFVIGFATAVVTLLITYRPIKPNLVIATVEVCMGLFLIGYAINELKTELLHYALKEEVVVVKNG